MAGALVLRAYSDADADVVVDLATDPYVPLIGTIPAYADLAQALAWIQRQRDRFAEGAGYLFAIADADTDRALGSIGLGLSMLPEGRASVGTPSLRGSVGGGWPRPRSLR